MKLKRKLWRHEHSSKTRRTHKHEKIDFHCGVHVVIGERCHALHDILALGRRPSNFLYILKHLGVGCVERKFSQNPGQRLLEQKRKLLKKVFFSFRGHNGVEVKMKRQNISVEIVNVHVDLFLSIKKFM